MKPNTLEECMEPVVKSDIPKLLRIVGATAMVLSATVFLLQGLQGMEQFFRFLAFTGLTMATATAGIFCARKLQEPKGARTLLALSTAAIPVLFAQFSAMIYEMLYQGQATFMPSILRFDGLSITELAVGFLVTGVVGSLVSYMGFSVLDREFRIPYFATFLGLNLMLLIPLRVGPIIFMPILLLIFGVWSLRSELKALQGWRMTLERQTATALLLIPVIVFLGRAAFHDITYVWFSGVLMFLAVAEYLRQFKSGNTESFGGSLTLGCFSLATLVISQMPSFDFPYRVMMALTAIHLTLTLAHRSGVSEARKVLVPVWMIGSIFVFLSAFSFVNYMMAATILACGTLGAFDGYQLKDREVFGCGAMLVLMGIGFNLYLAVQAVNLFHWLNLAVLGVTVLIGASYLERNHGELKGKVDLFLNRFSH